MTIIFDYSDEKTKRTVWKTSQMNEILGLNVVIIQKSLFITKLNSKSKLLFEVLSNGTHQVSGWHY